MMRIMVLGATGLVGRNVVLQALENEKVTHITAPVRNAYDIVHPKLSSVVMNYDDPRQDKDFWDVDAVICALGTTMEKAKSKEAFRKVDYQYPLGAAKIAKRHGAKTYVLNSAMGANAKSLIFYNRVKGELEHDLLQLGYPSLSFVRPGLIGGERSENRPAERRLLSVLKKLDVVLPKAWKINPAENIAKALLNAAIEQKQGVTVISSKELV